MRPTYETQADQQHEQAVVDLLCRKWDCSAHKTPKFYSVDWSLGKGRVVKAMAEIKFRNASYPTYILSLHKWVDMCTSSIMSGLPYLLVVCWPEDGKRVVRYLRAEHGVHDRVIHGGRTDRGDSQDVEPLVEISVSKFKLVGFYEEGVRTGA